MQNHPRAHADDTAAVHARADDARDMDSMIGAYAAFTIVAAAVGVVGAVVSVTELAVPGEAGAEVFVDNADVNRQRQPFVLVPGFVLGESAVGTC